jgi:para-nitrobenzyl esterase
VSVCTLLASPLTDGLFHAAINQSGPCLNDIAISDLTATTSSGPPAVDQGARIATALGCDTAAGVLACMRGKSAVDVMKARPNAIFLSATEAESWKPIVDHHVLTQSIAKTMKAGNAQKVPLLIGITADEGTLLVNSIGATPSVDVNLQMMTKLIGAQRAMQVLAHYPLDQFGGSATKQLARIIGDGVFLCPSQRAARDHLAAGNEVFAYRFTHITTIGAALGWGAFHGSDIPFVWGNPPTIGTQTIVPTAAEEQLIGIVQAYWASFSATRTPSGPSLPAWPAYDIATETRMDLDPTPSAQPGWPNPTDCAMWQTVLADDL